VKGGVGGSEGAGCPDDSTKKSKYEKSQEEGCDEMGMGGE
jgi:hypothetical protein